MHPPLASSVRLPFVQNQIETQLLCVFRKIPVIQFAKFSGFSPIITTASLKHSSYLQSLGATHVLDRNLHRGDIKTQIDEITDEAPIKYVYDAISLPDTQATTIKVMNPEGQAILVLSPQVKSIDRNITSVVALRQSEHNTEILKEMYTKLTEWVETGIIKVSCLLVSVGDDGLYLI